QRARDLRNNMNLIERRLWSYLRGSQLDGWKFRRQVPIGPYFVDFVCLAARLVVEMDGESHDSEAQVVHDDRRQEWLESQGYTVLRFSDDYRDDNVLKGVVEKILLALKELPTPSSPPARRGSA